MTYLLIFLFVSLISYFFLKSSARKNASNNSNLGFSALIGLAAVVIFILFTIR